MVTDKLHKYRDMLVLFKRDLTQWHVADHYGYGGQECLWSNKSTLFGMGGSLVRMVMGGGLVLTIN